MFNPDDHDREERLFDIHNANGRFSCKCDVCLHAAAPHKRRSKMKVLHPDSQEKAPLPPDTLRRLPEKVKRELAVRTTEQEYEGLGGFERSFCWLVEHLLPPNDNIKGCEAIFPETAFFEKGEAKLIVRMDKDFCLTSTRNAVKCIPRNIGKDFSVAVRDRKRHYMGIF